MAKKTALIAGATGVIGRYLCLPSEKKEDWEVIGISRRKPEKTDGVRYIEADLLQSPAAYCRSTLLAVV